jgi:hypothetical protein
MSADKFARLRELQRELVEELQREYFCEDVAVPTNAFGWSKDKIQAFFESGGAELSEQTMSDTTPVIRPSVANIVTEDVAMPCIVLVGDSITHFGSKVPGSAAMEMIVKDAFDFPPCPPIKDGPGWVTLLARAHSAAIEPSSCGCLPSAHPLGALCAQVTTCIHVVRRCSTAVCAGSRHA